MQLLNVINSDNKYGSNYNNFIFVNILIIMLLSCYYYVWSEALVGAGGAAAADSRFNVFEQVWTCLRIIKSYKL